MTRLQFLLWNAEMLPILDVMDQPLAGYRVELPPAGEIEVTASIPELRLNSGKYSLSVIATSGTQLKAAEVAAGISEALVLTFEGVAISVPAIYLFALFKDRVATLSVDAQNLAGEYVRKIHSSYASRTGTPGAGTPA